MQLHGTALNFGPYRTNYVRKVMREIRFLKRSMSTARDEELREKSLELKFLAKSGEPMRKLIAPAFALVQEASHRTLGMRHFDVQLKAGVNLVSKCIVEMATGEGKTLTALLPLYLFGLYGKGAHLATANDYLANRDGTEMEPVFRMLGISVGIIQHEKSDEERLEAYSREVTYGTLTEFGFDYLRDRMKRRAIKSIPGSHRDKKSMAETPVGRKLNFILVDEADSIMIDDASTPLIIGASTSQEDETKTQLYRWAADWAPEAKESREFRFIEHRKKTELTERGRLWARQSAANTAVAQQPSVDLYEFMERAIRVERDYFRDRNYVIDENKITIIDENTGRLAEGRFWQDGLHQAIQAREKLPITMPTASAAQLTVQSLVLSYPNRAGMTGTAKSSRREFRKVYKMRVIQIPTQKPCIRKPMATRFYRDESAKMKAIHDSVLELQRKGRPVLIGSWSVSNSEVLSRLFENSGTEHQVLNARHEQREAEIVALAGEKGRVTIATCMAGRGTDIKLNTDVVNAGGLHVIISELNDSKRIDRQLLGRCARQGDPGSYQIFVSLDDHLLDPKNKTHLWLTLLKHFPVLPRKWLFRRAQAQVNGKKMRDRLAMLENEKKRLRSLRQAGLDPVLDVVS